MSPCTARSPAAASATRLRSSAAIVLPSMIAASGTTPSLPSSPGRQPLYTVRRATTALSGDGGRPAEAATGGQYDGSPADAAADRPRLIGAEWIKSGAIVVDVGIT